VRECFFWFRHTRVVPDERPLNGCVCACVRACVCVCVCVCVVCCVCLCHTGCRLTVDLVVCVALGCDMFDCVFPTRTAVSMSPFFAVSVKTIFTNTWN